MNRIGSCLLTLALAAAPLAAGVIFEVVVTDHGQSSPRVDETQVAVEAKSLKMGIAAGERGQPGTLLYRADRREMVVVDHDDKSYMVIDEETVRQLGNQLNDQMAEALKNVPEEQRAMVEKMMQERMPPQPLQQPLSEVRKTGERGNHVGYPCVKYEVLRDGRKVSEMWVTDWSNIEGGREAAAVFLEMAEFMSDMLSALPMGGPHGGFGHSVFAQMKEFDGFPVVTRNFGDDGALDTDSILRSAQSRTLDPAEFEPPAGYKRRAMLGGS